VALLDVRLFGQKAIDQSLTNDLEKPVVKVTANFSELAREPIIGEL